MTRRFGSVHHGEPLMTEIERLQISKCPEKMRRDGGGALGNFPASPVAARPWLGSSYGVRVGIGILLRAFKLARKQYFYFLFDLKQLVYENLVNKMEKEIISEVMRSSYSGGNGIERILEESPCIAIRCEKLVKSIKKLKDSKEVVNKIMDGIAT